MGIARFVDDVLPGRYDLPARELSDRLVNTAFIDPQENGLMAAELATSPVLVPGRDVVIFDHPTWSC